jgi:protein-disulfide isomerase
MEGKKALILSTVAAALFLFAGAVTLQLTRKPVPVVLSAIDSPSMGKASAPVEIILIEDFQCRNCRAFSQKVIPKIQSQYVKTGKARFILVPVSFLTGSQMIANAALEVYYQKPDQFFSFLKDILHHEGDVKQADLIRFARRIHGIDINRFQSCLEKGCHNAELEKNLNWAQSVMGGQFRTPALYINGAPGSTFSFEAIQYQIEQILGKQ